MTDTVRWVSQVLRPFPVREVPPGEDAPVLLAPEGSAAACLVNPARDGNPRVAEVPWPCEFDLEFPLDPGASAPDTLASALFLLEVAANAGGPKGVAADSPVVEDHGGNRYRVDPRAGCGALSRDGRVVLFVRDCRYVAHDRPPPHQLKAGEVN